MSTFINITMIELVHSVGELMRRGIAKCSIGCPVVETNEVEVHIATYSLFATDHQCSLLTGSSYKFDHDSG